MDASELTEQIRAAAARVTNAGSAQAYTAAYAEWARLCTKRERMLAASLDEDI